MKTSYKLLSSIALSAIALSNSFNFPVLARTLTIEDDRLVWEFVPPNDGAPDDRGDAGSRTECPLLDVPFQVLTPQTNFSLTLSEYPTFWLYIPDVNSVPKTVEFVLQDEAKNNEEIYQTEFQVTQKNGIVSFRVPEDAPPLELGRKYRWEFNLFCYDNDNKSTSDSGVILRTSLAEEIPDAIDRKLEVYAQNAIWHELLTELIQLRCIRPEDEEISSQWTKLLQHSSIGLEGLIDAPILEGCDPSL